MLAKRSLWALGCVTNQNSPRPEVTKALLVAISSQPRPGSENRGYGLPYGLHHKKSQRVPGPTPASVILMPSPSLRRA
jgi:hypothetical protein